MKSDGTMINSILLKKIQGQKDSGSWEIAEPKSPSFRTNKSIVQNE